MSPGQTLAVVGATTLLAGAGFAAGLHVAGRVFAAGVERLRMPPRPEPLDEPDDDFIDDQT